MSWRLRYTGHADIDPRHPSALGICQRCAMQYNLRDLNWQFEVRGKTVRQLNILVCKGCRDVPAKFLYAQNLQPDPRPIPNARIEFYALDENDYRITEDVNQRTTEDDNNRVIDESADESQ